MISGKALLYSSPSLTKSCLADCRELWGTVTTGCCVSSPYLEQSNYGDRELGSGLVKKGIPETVNRSGLIPFPAVRLRIFHTLICYGFLPILLCFVSMGTLKTRTTDKFLSAMRLPGHIHFLTSCK